MEKKNDKKKVSIVIPIIWTIITAIWIATVCINISSGENPEYLIALQCGAVAASGAAAIANFIRYKRYKNNNGE